jgi:hypothetical protein
MTLRECARRSACRVGAQGIIQCVSKGWHEQLGILPGDLLGLDIYSLVMDRVNEVGPLVGRLAVPEKAATIKGLAGVCRGGWSQ